MSNIKTAADARVTRIIRWDLERSSAPYEVDLLVADNWDDDVLSVRHDDKTMKGAAKCRQTMVRALCVDGLIDSADRAFEFIQRIGVDKNDLYVSQDDRPNHIIDALIGLLGESVSPREFRARALQALSAGDFVNPSAAAHPMSLEHFDVDQFLRSLRAIPKWRGRLPRQSDPASSEHPVIDAFSAALAEQGRPPEVARTLMSLAMDGSPAQKFGYRNKAQPNDNMGRLAYSPGDDVGKDRDDQIINWALMVHDILRLLFTTPAFGADAIEKSLCRMQANAAIARAHTGQTPRGFVVDQASLQEVNEETRRAKVLGYVTSKNVGPPPSRAAASTSQLAARFGGDRS